MVNLQAASSYLQVIFFLQRLLSDGLLQAISLLQSLTYLKLNGVKAGAKVRLLPAQLQQVVLANCSMTLVDLGHLTGEPHMSVWKCAVRNAAEPGGGN